MRRSLLAAAAIAAAALAPVAARAGDFAPPPVRLQTSIEAGPHLFGDLVRARLDVFVDRRRADAADVRVETRFAPYRRIGAARREQATSGDRTRISYAYVLECLEVACVTLDQKPQRKFTFPRVVVRYRDLHGVRGGVAVKWPTFRMVSRYRPKTLLTATEIQQQARFGGTAGIVLLAPVDVPAPSYRIAPGLLAALLLAATLVALAGAGAAGAPVVARLGASRARAAQGPSLTPLEHAVALVERTARERAGTADHREALARLARELGHAGMRDLVRPARRLAWSAEEPSAEESRELTRRVREATGSAG